MAKVVVLSIYPHLTLSLENSNLSVIRVQYKYFRRHKLVRALTPSNDILISDFI